MYLTYFDESGDAGVTNSPTDWFVLNAVLVHETVWLKSRASLVALRRNLRDKYGLSPRDELKAIHFKNGRGAFRTLGLSRARRMQIYHEILASEFQLGIQTFSVAVVKRRAAQDGWDPRYAAWAFCLQALSQFCLAQDDWAVLYPDEGHGNFIRRCVRDLRREGKTSLSLSPIALPLSIERILEDPSDRHSHDSYFVQLADLNAYAAHRAPGIDAGARGMDRLWESLNGASGDARIRGVNTDDTGAVGILTFPK